MVPGDPLEPAGDDARSSSLDGLRELARLRSSLTGVERELVVAARREGGSWSSIGRALGCSRQAAQQRFAAVDPRPRPPRPPDPAEAALAALARRLARAGVKLP